MMNDTDRTENMLAPEDYVEPACLLNMEDPVKKTPIAAVPQQRIIAKMNEYMAMRDYAGAEKHLLYWREEAKAGRDQGGELMICNELVGHYRKTGEKEKAFAAAADALSLLDVLEMEGTVSAGTACVNIATAYNAFGENEAALPLFEKAEAAYAASANVRPELAGGLHNNMALTLQALGRYGEALAHFEKAMELMKDVPGGALEQAITCLNTADTLEAAEGMEHAEQRIYALVDRAEELLEDPEAPRDGYYAFVCEKCEPSFRYYGYFAAADRLHERAEQIYAQQKERME